MKNPVMLRAAACAAVLLVPLTPGYAAAPGISSQPANCDSVAKAVRAQIEKDPQKVLLVVEDFMVSNEACAADIVKAAILSTKGPADLIKQIAITATHVAPQMAKAIADAVASIAPDEATVVQAATQKEAGNESAALAQNQPSQTDSSSTDSGSADDYKLPLDLRGVFFIQPAVPGPILNGSTTSSSSGSTTSTTTAHVTTKKVVAQVTVSRPPNRPSALSPSSGSP